MTINIKSAAGDSAIAHIISNEQSTRIRETHSLLYGGNADVYLRDGE